MKLCECLSHIPRNALVIREKEEIWLSPMAEAQKHPEKIQKAMWQHINATKNLDHTTTDGRLENFTTATQLVWLNRFTGSQPSC